MESLVYRIASTCNEILESSTNSVVDSWALMGSPVPILCVLVSYLVFVLTLGPKMMANRPAFQLKTVMILYNGIQVAFSAWLCLKIARSDLVRFLSLDESEPQDENSVTMTQLASFSSIWWYLMAKVTELLDTIFFVLRKKQSQVTFLHLYHHATMVLFTWLYLKLIPSGQALFIGFLNSFVHVVMYSYYLIAALGPAYQKYLWWKKYMTWMQLTQFGIMFFYLAYLWFSESSLSKVTVYFFGPNVTLFMYLFADFYLKTYKQKNA